MSEHEHEAGRELDALIAEKVMGMRLPTQDEMRTEAVRVWKNQPQCQRFTAFGGFGAWPKDEAAEAHGFAADRCIFRPHVRQYSTDIAAAWEVLDHFRQQELEWSIVVDTDRVTVCNYWVSSITGAHELYGGWEMGSLRRQKVEASAPTAPLAVCRAALKAVGVEAPA